MHRLFDPAFPGDINLLLRELQASSFSSLAPQLFFRAQTRYLDSARLVFLQADFIDHLNEVHSGNLEFLEAPYAVIAAWYRFEQHDLARQEFTSAGEKHENRFTQAWAAPFTTQVTQLVAHHFFTQEVLRFAAVPAGVEHTIIETLQDFLEDRYGNLVQKARRIHRLGWPPSPSADMFGTA